MQALRAFVISVGLLAGQVCLAQSGDSGAGGAPEKYYQVEVIAFQYTGPPTNAGEQFDQLEVEAWLPPEPFDIDADNRRREAVSYTDVRYLAQALERLRGSARYQVMTANAWIQPLLSESESIAVPIGYDSRTAPDPVGAASRRAASPRLSGSLRIFGDHLLFADIELAAVLPGGGSDGDGAGSGAMEAGAGSGAGPAPGATPVGSGMQTYHLSQRRRIKLEERHYFDHPFIGALISVTRHEKGGDG